MLDKVCEWDRYFAHRGLKHKLSAAWLRWAWESVFYTKSITGVLLLSPLFFDNGKTQTIIMENSIEFLLWGIWINMSILFQRLAWTGNWNKLLGWPKHLFGFFLKMFMEKPEGIFVPRQYCTMMSSYLSFCVVNITSFKRWVVLKKRLKKKFCDKVGSMWFIISLRPVIWNKTSEHRRNISLISSYSDLWLELGYYFQTLKRIATH